MNDEDMYTWPSPLGVSETVDLIVATLAHVGAKVFAVIDQQAEARAVGLDMQALTLILFGNPRAGTPLMQADPTCAFDLPLKLLVHAHDDGRARVQMLRAETFVSRYDVPANAAGVFTGAAALLESALLKAPRAP
ncbi:DUF302 domain-containing protein [Pararobbsia silviterrae]|uniref:DUF302 domain-containing protein n=1 Tax=Pararobbsia silviterrae TaxID=1792498 RepID=A0A494X748_9BURK|nr:DUF302 domain-containing protein [Pararobbsia silviterrae]RKP46545.1 DUF302 domain-containing protein [Pararobbsia silviterrae]